MNKPFAQQVSRSLFLLALSCLLIFLLAACGGDTASSTASTVSNSNSSTNTGGAPGKVITIKETHGASGDTYMFDQTQLTVTKGETVTIKNESDEVQDVSDGDASKAGVNVSVGVNRSEPVTFNVPGTFSIKTNKGATISVTVQQ